MIVNKLRIFFDIDYKTSIEYWIPISEIKIKNIFLATPPSYFKYRRKLNNFIKYGELSPKSLIAAIQLEQGRHMPNSLSNLVLKIYNFTLEKFIFR